MPSFCSFLTSTIRKMVGRRCPFRDAVIGRGWPMHGEQRVLDEQYRLGISGRLLYRVARSVFRDSIGVGTTVRRSGKCFSTPT